MYTNNKGTRKAQEELQIVYTPITHYIRYILYIYIYHYNIRIKNTHCDTNVGTRSFRIDNKNVISFIQTVTSYTRRDIIIYNVYDVRCISCIINNSK